LKIKTILISQPDPGTAKSPYSDLADSTNVKIDFRPFIQVEGVPAKEFRQTRIHILDHTAVIFNSRTAIDHFFRLAQEMRVTIPDTMKYFCISEATAFYLQKYIVYRKRKIFYGNGTVPDLLDTMKKHKDEKFLLPLSDIHSQEIPRLLDKGGYKYTTAILYRTVCSDLSDEFKQNDTKIASFGANTAQAVKDAGLVLNIEAPTPEAPSMTMALEQYIKNVNKTK